MVGVTEIVEKTVKPGGFDPPPLFYLDRIRWPCQYFRCREECENLLTIRTAVAGNELHQLFASPLLTLVRGDPR